MNDIKLQDAFGQLLSVFWLRPETALWRSIDIKAMQDFEFKRPSLDLGCGDGIFSFIRAGGTFDINFDAYKSMGNLDKYFENADVYDNYNSVLKPLITHKPDYKIDIGFDHKINLLAKAATLGLYEKCINGNANAALPFQGDSFNSIFSNIIYWLNSPEKVFAEIERVLRPGGIACVMLPNSSYPEFSFYHEYYLTRKNQAFAYLEYLDRGRISENLKQAKSFDQWREIIESSGLKIIRHTRHISKTTVQIWDIGLRPLFPVLVKMISNIDKIILSGIKHEWIQTFEIFLRPVSEMDDDLTQGREPAFHCMFLQKQKS